MGSVRCGDSEPVGDGACGEHVSGSSENVDRFRRCFGERLPELRWDQTLSGPVVAVRSAFSQVDLGFLDADGGCQRGPVGAVVYFVGFDPSADR